MLYMGLILLFAYQTYGMKRGGSPIPNIRPTKVANTQDVPNPFASELYKKIEDSIYAADPVAIEQLLSQPQAHLLNPKEKYELNALIKDVKEALLMNPVTGAADLKRIAAIENYLFAYEGIPQFKFPQVFFSADPYNRPADTRPDLSLIIAGLIKNEKEKIYVCCFHFTLGSLGEALVEQKDKGVSVEIITNQSQGSKPQDKFIITKLQESGIPVLSPQNDKFEQMHHKFFIFQKNLLDKRLLVIGSYNPTKHGNTNSWDDIMILDDPVIIDQYLARFEEVKSRSK